jgi:hypothetical protein
MAVIGRIFEALFGEGRNVIAETAGVFRENAEAGAVRDAKGREQALAQFGAEFGLPRKGLFDRFIDGLNRLPRPLLAFGTIGLFVAAMTDPIWFASRMQGVALVPEPLWWLMGAIVSFYFGSRHQLKSQEFQQSIAQTVGLAGQVTRNIRSLDALSAGASLTEADPDPAEPDPAGPATGAANPALDDWRRGGE